MDDLQSSRLFRWARKPKRSLFVRILGALERMLIWLEDRIYNKSQK